MARVKIETIIDHLAPEIERALEATLRAAAGDAEIDPRRLFIAFSENVRRQCRTWEKVPDRSVHAD